MSGIIAYEIAKKLSIDKPNAISSIIISSCKAPHLPRKNTSSLTNEQFLNILKQYNSIPNSILEAGSEFIENYDCLPYINVPYDIHCIFSSEEQSLQKPEILEWNEYTSKKFHSYEFIGDHFFINHNNLEFQDRVNSIITQELQNI